MAVACTTLFSCKSDEYKKVTSDPFLYSKTVKKLNDIVLENNFPPMIAARNYAYANIAAYECIVAGDSSYHTLSGQMAGLPPMPKPAPNSQLDYRFAALLAFTKVGNAVTFPEGSMMGYYDELVEKIEDAGMPSQMVANSKAFADSVFSVVMEWSKKDNYAQTRSASKYTVTDEEGRWVPTPPSYTSAMESHWMEIRTLALDSAQQFKPIPPPLYSIKDTTAMFYKNLMQVKHEGDTLSDEEKHMADFWDDNPFKLNVNGHVMFATKKFSPGGHWMNIVGIACQNSGADFNTTVYAYTKTAVALFDGFISCWDEKFRSNVVRPETIINKYIDPDWRPYIQTPPFPAYISGHSVISAAAAEVMTDIFGDNFSYRDTSESEFGIPPRSFKSFRDAAWEASMSRMYGGIHYMFDLVEGNKQGREVGQLVVQRLKMKPQK
ncbi:MAG: vanadium-dependent haloperoxidase [Chitinophagaceae bacterium]|nr:vanadium-dependent haloperoxidase [Chitinophagaceae bacterium]